MRSFLCKWDLLLILDEYFSFESCLYEIYRSIVRWLRELCLGSILSCDVTSTVLFFVKNGYPQWRERRDGRYQVTRHESWRTETIYANIAPCTDVNVDAKAWLDSPHKDKGTRKRKRHEFHRRRAFTADFRSGKLRRRRWVRREKSKQANMLSKGKKENKRIFDV